MSYRIRTATQADAAALLHIYEPYVSDTCISFETEVPTLDEFERRIRVGTSERAYLVAEIAESGGLAGYAYHSAYRARPAYAWAAETSIYLAPEHQGQGIGSALLDTLEQLMAAQGVRMSEACITSTNSSSIAFHERHGYRFCGENHHCGYKLGRWLSVTWMEKQLAPLDNEPDPLRPLDPSTVAEIINDANTRLASPGVVPPPDPISK